MLTAVQGPETMKPLAWTDAMSVGVPMLDADHRCLVRIINLLSDVNETDAPHVVRTVLDTLLVYGHFHFDREERVMAATSFPGAAVHVAEHRTFSKYVDGLRRAFDARRAGATASDLFDYLTDWLRHHILIQDMAYKPYVANESSAQNTAERADPHLPALACAPA